MKNLILAAMLVVGLTTFAQEEKKPIDKKAAMEKMTPEQRSAQRLKRVTSILNLTEKQQKEIAPILEEQQQKREASLKEFKAMKEKGTKPTEEEKAARAKLRADYQKAMRDRLEKILTAEQMTKWDEMVERNKERMMEKKKERMNQ